jgi:RNA polymerase sigma-70 factor, ECF subfamily
VVVTLRRRPQPPPDDDGTPDPLAAVFEAALAGDEAAFRLLYRGVQPGLVRYLRVLVGADADDVASETWLQVCRDLPRFSGDLPGFRAWCATVGRNRAMDHLRRVRRRPETVPDDTYLMEVADPADTAALASDAIATGEALALIGKLPPDQAEAVLLRVVVGLDAASAAKVLGKRPGAVRTAAHRGLRRLAEILERGHA